MHRFFAIFGFLSLGAGGVVAPAFAHHSSFAFDVENLVTIHGTITEWYWANPHCILKIEVQSDGEVVGWAAETQAPANLIDAGWRKNVLKPGDKVAVTLRPARNGNLVGSIVSIEFADGRILSAEQDRTGETGNLYHLSGAPTD